MTGYESQHVDVRTSEDDVRFRCLHGAPSRNTELVRVDVQLPAGGAGPVVRVDLSGSLVRVAVCVDGKQVWGTVP